MKRIPSLIYRAVALTGLWLALPLYLIIPHTIPSISSKQIMIINIALIAWVTLNNLWGLACEGKRLDEMCIGDGLIPETGLQKESTQKKIATYPKVPKKYLNKEPEGVILGTYKNQYVRIPTQEIYHYCVIGGSRSGKTSTVLLDTLLANFATKKNDFLTYAIDIKGELHIKSSYSHSPDIMVVNPTDQTTAGWDVYYRLRDNPSDDLIIEVMQEVASALIISTSKSDSFFVNNAQDMFVGMLLYFYQQGENFIDSVNKILESEIKSLIGEIIKSSEPSDLHYKYLAKFDGKDAESVEDCMVELTTNLSVFGSKSDIKYCFRDNPIKASPFTFKENKSVFLAIPEHMLESYKAILRLCTVQTLKEMERRPDASGKEVKNKPMIILIDEFARLGRMEGIFNALATLASKKISVILAFQSLAQCEVIYSKEEARVLMDNCRVKVICEVSDPQSAKAVQDWCGKYREKKETLSAGKNRHKTYTYEDKDIVQPNDLITLVNQEEVILIISGVGYLRPKKCYYFKDSQISKLAQKVRNHNTTDIPLI
ncbi:type IV secretory system conjugative DNA transfer family protein [Enterocloster bolteae]|uniref:type IV secretory system conjugative DNA transfer family protein n=1 Tax=Enterocloster bolteae TaxID=208479 RepID=UPI002A7F1F17|nr:type IV secretory system conjugative DNA transfer family protein [Enterocloster bolteae]